MVQSGELTLYRADDPACTPHVFVAGSGFVDQGGDVHVVRSEGNVDAVVYVTSIIPKWGDRGEVVCRWGLCRTRSGLLTVGELRKAGANDNANANTQTIVVTAHCDKTCSRPSIWMLMIDHQRTYAPTRS